MEATMKTDVLIVGAGPTGLAIACQLIRHGVDFVITEKREGTTPFSKAIGVQARKTEPFRASGDPDLPASNEKNATPEIAT